MTTETPKPWTLARRNRTAAAALEMYRGGQSERDAVTNAIGGKPISLGDRDLVATELARLIDADASDPQPGPALAVVEPEGDGEEPTGHGCPFCAYQGSDFDPAKPCPDCGLVAHEPTAGDVVGTLLGPDGVTEIDVPRWAADHMQGRDPVDAAREGEHDQPMDDSSKGKRRSIDTRLIDAKVKLAAAEYEVRKLELLKVAELLDCWPKGKPAARMVRASVFAGFVTEAEPYAYKGAIAIGVVLPEPLPSMHVLAKLLDEVPR